MNSETPIGKVLHQIRRYDVNITQDELSKKTGISRSQISEIESCLVEPRFSTVEKLARGMGISMLDVVKKLLHELKNEEKESEAVLN